MSTDTGGGPSRAQELLSLLRSKNRCLERFLGMTEDFWVSAREGMLDGLQVFESRREATLRAIELFDRKIEELSALLSSGERDRLPVEEARTLIEERERIVHRILAVDLKVIEAIEKERGRLLQQIAATRKGREGIARFRSAWLSESGEELDQKL